MTRTMTRRPRIPLWAAVGIPAAAYVLRSIIRGSFALDIPGDLVVAGAFSALLLVAVLARATSHGSGDELPAQMDDDNDHERRDG